MSTKQVEEYSFFSDGIQSLKSTWHISFNDQDQPSHIKVLLEEQQDEKNSSKEEASSSPLEFSFPIDESKTVKIDVSSDELKLSFSASIKRRSIPPDQVLHVYLEHNEKIYEGPIFALVKPEEEPKSETDTKEEEE